MTIRPKNVFQLTFCLIKALYKTRKGERKGKICHNFGKTGFKLTNN